MSICRWFRPSGFSLLELMITLSIIGALAAIAIPQYTQYVHNAQISQALGKLAASRIAMEQYFQVNRSYANGNNCGVNVADFNTTHFSVQCSVTDNTGVFLPNQFLITATNIAGVGMGAVGSYSFTVNQTGAQSTIAFNGTTLTTPLNCWTINSADCY